MTTNHRKLPTGFLDLNIAFGSFNRYKIVCNKIFVLLLALIISSSVHSQLVTQNSQGNLVYATYANRGQSNALNKVPDFSHAGYEGGGVAIPDVPVKIVVNPVNGDDGAIIQAAIDQVSAMAKDSQGFRGAILLKAGTYQIEDNLIITVSGVVLRGEGQGITGGTKLIATGQDKRDLIRVEANGSSVEVPNTTTAIDQSFVPVGSNTIKVVSSANLNVGNKIFIERTPNQKWLDDMDNMGQWGWTPEYYTVGYERRITAINGNVLTIDAPNVQTIENQYGGGRVYRFTFPDRVNNVGIENLRLESEFDSDDDETHGWNAIRLKGVGNGWVRKVTAQFFGYSCVMISGASGDFSPSKFITVEDCAMLDPKSQTTGGRKYSFVINSTGGQNILFQRCFTRGGRHDYVTQRQVAGPNVFLDCMAKNTNSAIGPHQRYSTGILFDNILGGEMEVKNREGSGTGHGWAGAQIMFWNCESTSNNGNRAGYFGISSPPTGLNWGVGNIIGDYQIGDGVWESINTPVVPRSLYLAQLEDRLGASAVNNVTTAAQRSGNIWTQLDAWAGEGDPGNVLVTRKYEAEDLSATSTGANNYDIIDTNASNEKLNKLNGNGIGDYVEYELDIPQSGTFAVKVGVKKNPSRGIFQLNFPNSGIDVGTPIDLYASTGSYPEINLGDFTFTGNSLKKFRFTVIDKNNNSSGYTLMFDYIKLVPTDQNFSIFGTLNVPVSGSIAEPDLEGSNVKIYPNPTSDVLNIEMSSRKEKEAEISIFDMSGKEIFTAQSYLKKGINFTTTSLSNLINGTYLVKIKLNDNQDSDFLIIKK